MSVCVRAFARFHNEYTHTRTRTHTHVFVLYSNCCHRPLSSLSSSPLAGVRFKSLYRHRADFGRVSRCRRSSCLLYPTQYPIPNNEYPLPPSQSPIPGRQAALLLSECFIISGVGFLRAYFFNKFSVYSVYSVYLFTYICYCCPPRPTPRRPTLHDTIPFAFSFCFQLCSTFISLSVFRLSSGVFVIEFQLVCIVDDNSSSYFAY